MLQCVRVKTYMKILLATPLYPPEIGGPATYAKLLATELPKRGVEIEILPFSTVRHLPKGIRHIAYFLKVVRRGRNSDIIFAQDIFSVGLPALWAAKLLKKKFIIRVPGDYAWEQAVQRFGVTDNIEMFQKKRYSRKIEFLRKLTRGVVKGADIVMTPSAYFTSIVRTWPGGEKAHTVYNGIAIDHMAVKSQEKENRHFTLISAGRLVPWKGFAPLIGLLKKHPTWCLSVVGDGPERESLKSKVESLQLENRVVFTGTLPQNELFQKIAESDVFVLNSSFESFSYQVVEAMALGTPVVATKGCNLEEIIHNGKEGILVEQGNTEALESALVSLENDTELRKRLSINAVARVKDFTIEKTVDTFLSLI